MIAAPTFWSSLASPLITDCTASIQRARLQGRDFVSPDDVQEIYADVLRHRILLSYEAEADGWTADQILQKLLQHVPVP